MDEKIRVNNRMSSRFIPEFGNNTNKFMEKIFVYGFWEPNFVYVNEVKQDSKQISEFPWLRFDVLQLKIKVFFTFLTKPIIDVQHN